MTNAEGFKEVMARWPTGISIITAAADDVWGGFTANSFASVSISPFLISMSVDKKSETLALIQKSNAFAVNILREEQQDWGMRFAGMIPEYEGRRFEDIEISLSENGCPLLPNVLAWMDCTVYQSVDLNKSILFLGEVTGTYWQDSGRPLAYWNRQWGRFTPQD